MPVLAAQTGAAVSYAVPGGNNYRIGHINERVTGTGYQPFLTLTNPIPAGARLIMSAMKSATAIPIRLGSSAAATAGQGAAVVVWTVPTSITTSHSTNSLMTLTAQSAFAANIPINQAGVSIWDVAAAATNDLLLAVTTYNNAHLVATAARTLYVVPYAATTAAEAAQRFQVGTSTAATVATTGYTFGTSTSDSYSFDVQVTYEEIVPTPNA